MNICVFCAASNRIDSIYFETAETVGRFIGQRKDTLVYGGGRVGMMGRMAAKVHQFGGKVVGVIPEKLKTREIAYDGADELIMTDGMLDRKEVLMARADLFVGLAGGFGTLDEMLEVITHRQLAYHDKPIYFLNTLGFFDGLLAYFDELEGKNFIHGNTRDLYEVLATPEALFEQIGTISVSERNQ